jgi:hypothetical protein
MVKKVGMNSNEHARDNISVRIIFLLLLGPAYRW